MDDLDENIISSLRRDARTSYSSIAAAFGVSEGTVRNRVDRMQRGGDIQGFTVVTGSQGRAIVGIETNPSLPTQEVIERFRDIGIQHMFEVTGRFDVVCFVNGENMEAVNDRLEAIRTTEGVVNTETFMVLKTN